MTDAAPPMPEPLPSIDLEANRGPIVNIIVWILFVFSSLAVVSKVLGKISRSAHDEILRRLQWDDGLLLAAMFCGLAQSLMTSRQANAGLGRPLDTLSTSENRRFFQFELASQVFYVFTMGVAKTAGYFFALLLRPVQGIKRVLYGLLIVVALWQAASIFAVSFQCRVPRTWNSSDRCVNRGGLWIYFEVVNVILDLTLVAVLCWIVVVLQIPSRKKAVLSLAFAVRLLTIPPIIARVVFLQRSDELRRSGDFEDNQADPFAAMSSAVAMNVAIFATCVVFLKPLMDQLTPGWSSSDLKTGAGYGTRSNLTYASNLSSRYLPGTVIADGSRALSSSHSQASQEKQS